MTPASKPVLLAAALVFGLCCWGLAAKSVDQTFLRFKVVQKRAPDNLKVLSKDPRMKGCAALTVQQSVGPHKLKVRTGKKKGSACAVGVTLSAQAVTFEARAPGGGTVSRAVPLGLPTWTGLLPPLIAIVLAAMLRNVFLALGAGIVAGWILGGGFPFDDVFSDPFKLKTMLFTSAVICMVTLLGRNGGMHALVGRIARKITSSRSSQGATVGAGTLLFFDDYANALVVGGTFKGLTDRFRISRAKLAYLVDSTSAPIAGIALVSTWVGYEVGQIQDSLPSSLEGLNGYGVFLSSLPFRFYCLFTIFFVVFNVWRRREWGPMRAVEAAARRGRDISRGADPSSALEALEGVRARMSVAVIPIVFLVVGIFVGLIVDGYLRLKAPPDFPSVAFFRETLGAADNMLVMATFALAASGLAIVLSWRVARMKMGRVLRSYGAGARSLPSTLGILILAWGLQSVTSNLDAGLHLMSAFRDWLAPATFPALVFLLSGAMAFATGTSWGTMAILIPIATPMALDLGGVPLLIISVGAVLDGSIFGDHCSPISDTTVMSSIASGCNHLDHVRTQIPYALLSMAVALGAGYAVAPSGFPYWASWLVGFGAIAAIQLALFRRVEAR